MTGDRCSRVVDVLSSFVGGMETINSYVEPEGWAARGDAAVSEYFAAKERGDILGACRAARAAEAYYQATAMLVTVQVMAGGANSGRGLNFRSIFRQGARSKSSAAPGSLGAMRRLEYERNPKHGRTARRDVSPEPRDGQAALNQSVPSDGNSSARVGVDYEDGDIIQFHEHRPGKFHGFVVQWDKLRKKFKGPLIEAEMTDRRGRMRRD